MKRDIKYINYISRRFGISRYNIGEQIHSAKRGLSPRASLRIEENGDIYYGEEFLDSLD